MKTQDILERAARLGNGESMQSVYGHKEPATLARPAVYTAADITGFIIDMLEDADTETVLSISNDCLSREFEFVEDGEYDKFVEVLEDPNCSKTLKISKILDKQ